MEGEPFRRAVAARLNASRSRTVLPGPGSNRSMRRLSCACVLLLLTASACAARRPAPVVTPAAPTPADRLASADALVRAGCLDCLVAAYGEYDLLRTFPFAKDAATAGAARTAALIAR